MLLSWCFFSVGVFLLVFPGWVVFKKGVLSTFVWSSRAERIQIAQVVSCNIARTSGWEASWLLSTKCIGPAPGLTRGAKRGCYSLGMLFLFW